jgi:hypothetical protein
MIYFKNMRMQQECFVGVLIFYSKKSKDYLRVEGVVAKSAKTLEKRML